jgi:hypothetical protein
MISRIAAFAAAGSRSRTARATASVTGLVFVLLLGLVI